MTLRRLHPAPGAAAIDPEAAMEGLALHALAPADRPYVVVNMVVTVDGRAALDGRSWGIGGATDRALFHGLRGQVDAVLAGTGTLRVERYTRLVKDAARRAARAARGLSADPLAVVLSRSGDVADLPLLAVAEQETVVFRGDDAEPRRALERLRAQHGVRSLLCEGGPRLNAALLRDGLVDELFLSVSPLLAGGEEPLTIVAGDGPTAPAALSLVWLLEDEGALFARYRVGP